MGWVDRDGLVPKRVARVDAGDPAAPATIAASLAAGADGVLLAPRSSDPLPVRRLMVGLRRAPEGGDAAVLVVDGAVEIAVAVGCGVLLAERGVAVAEARRRLGDGPLIGRWVTGAAAAAAAGGSDFLVVPAGRMAGGGEESTALTKEELRRIVAATWAPVLVVVGTDGLEVAAAQAVGVHGIVVDGDSGGDGNRLLRRLRPMAGVGSVEAPRSGESGTDGGATGVIVVTVNGVAMTVEAETTVGDLVSEGGWKAGEVVAAVNGERIGRHRFDEVMVAGGDEVRITAGGG